MSTPSPSFASLPPPLPANLVPRPALEARVGPVAPGRLSLIVGPPGAGKTTLARRWTSTLKSAWAWINLDSAMGQPTQFWAAFARAVDWATRGRIVDALDDIEVDHFDERAVLTGLVDSLVEAATSETIDPIAVVVDDAHHLTAACWQQLGWLVDHQPPALHLVLLSRSDPPFSVARMRAHGKLTEVRGDELAMSEADAETLFRQADPSRADWLAVARRLHQRTDGWVAGLRLALLALERGADAQELVTQFSGTDRAVAELLVDEVLDHQPPDVREFLRGTSVVSELDPGIATTLTGRRDSADLLRRLAADQLFISPIEHAADRYRFHPLLAELLRYELRSIDPGAERRLHRVAAHHIDAQGRTGDATEHALAGDDPELAGDLVLRHLGRLSANGRRTDTARWLTRLVTDYEITDPPRLVELTEALLFVGCEVWLSTHRRATAVTPRSRRDLWSRLIAMSAVGWATQGKVEQWAEAAHRAASLRPDSGAVPFDEISEAWRARMLSRLGRHQEAIATATDLVAGRRVLVTDGPALSVLAGTLDAAGDPTAPQVAEQAISEWRRLGEPDLLGMVDACSIAALAALVSDDLDQAELFAENAVAVSVDQPIHLLTVIAAQAAAAVDVAAGRADDARLRLDDLARRARRAGLAADVVASIGLPMDGPTASRHTGLAGAEQLTSREMDVLRLLQSHLNFPEIGRELYISRPTVKTHVRHIYRKLGVSSRSAAISRAQQLGLLGGRRAR